MRVMIRNTTLDGKPLEGESEVFTGKNPLEVLRAMKGASLFWDQRGIEDYIDMVLRNAKMLSGVELAVRGDTPEEKAASLLDALVAHGSPESLVSPKPLSGSRSIPRNTPRASSGASLPSRKEASPDVRSCGSHHDLNILSPPTTVLFTTPLTVP